MPWREAATIRPEMKQREGADVKKTIRELREERGESRMQLAAAIGVTLDDVVEWEQGRTEPTTSRLRVLSEHFGVRDDQIDLRPGHDPSIAERLADPFSGGE